MPRIAIIFVTCFLVIVLFCQFGEAGTELMDCAPGTIDLVCINGSCFDRCAMSVVSCDIQLNDATYGDEETVVAKHLRLVNNGTLPVAVEVGLWFEGPTIPPMTYANVGADGSLVLPTGFDRDFGPITLFQVSHDFPRGIYAFNCRIVHPVTKKLLAENLNSFDVE